MLITSTRLIKSEIGRAPARIRRTGNPPFRPNLGLCLTRLYTAMNNLSIAIYKKGVMPWKSRKSARVPDSLKVYGNCQKVYTGCKDVITDFEAKKEVNALRQPF